MTDTIHAEAIEWQTRPLCVRYAAVQFGAMCVDVDDDGVVLPRTVYLALGVVTGILRGATPCEVLGAWIAEHGEARFWRDVFDELADRGVERMRVVLADLSTEDAARFACALRARFPEARAHVSLNLPLSRAPHDLPTEAQNAVVLAARAVEELDLRLCRAIRRHGPFQSDAAAVAFVRLALRDVMRC